MNQSNRTDDELTTLITNLRLEIYKRSFTDFPDRKHYESLLNKLILEQSTRLKTLLSIKL